MSLEQEINELTAAIREFTRRAYPGPPRPKLLAVKLISERRINDMDFLTYEATLPVVPSGTDVESQSLVISVDGEVRPVVQLPVDATTHTFEVPQDSNVTLTFRYIDDGGNSSPDRVQTFTALDTIPPDAPGEFGEIRLIGERREEPVPTPTE